MFPSTKGEALVGLTWPLLKRDGKMSGSPCTALCSKSLNSVSHVARLHSTDRAKEEKMLAQDCDAIFDTSMSKRHEKWTSE
jgi:hypothetical protein